MILETCELLSRTKIVSSLKHVNSQAQFEHFSRSDNNLKNTFWIYEQFCNFDYS